MTLSGSDIAIIAAAVVANLVGTGFLGKVLLQSHRSAHERDLAHLASKLEADIRKLQTAFDRSSTVHRVQFESEFRAIQTIWTAVMNLRGFMAALRPDTGLAPVDEKEEQYLERLNGRFKLFSGALADAKDAIYQNELFIPEPIFKELYNVLLLAAQAEHTNIQLYRNEIRTSRWYERGQKNLGDLMISANQVGQMVRARFRDLTILPD